MNTFEKNKALVEGEHQARSILPHLESLNNVPFIFETEFGLTKLPTEPGIILIRGARQYGKSTWLEQQIDKTIKEFGKGSALYLNGDEITDVNMLIVEIRETIALFPQDKKIKRLFIDEITAVTNWENALKRLADGNEIQDILVITIGSKATCLRRGTERLSGRKGKLGRTNYIFTPISYNEFKQKCEKTFGKQTLWAYILSGGSPIAANEIARHNRIPEYLTTMTYDWILGEFLASGRARKTLLNVFQPLYQFGGTPLGQTKLAKESKLANNTVAKGYISLLEDLLCIAPSYPLAPNSQQANFRKPCKYHFINLLAAITMHPQKLKKPADLIALNKECGPLLEWVVAQELWRRACLKSTDPFFSQMLFWQSKTHELDFALTKNHFLTIKKGKENPMNFKWFLTTHPQSQLTVINSERFKTKYIQGVTLEDFLLGELEDLSLWNMLR